MEPTQADKQKAREALDADDPHASIAQALADVREEAIRLCEKEVASLIWSKDMLDDQREIANASFVCAIQALVIMRDGDVMSRTQEIVPQ